MENGHILRGRIEIRGWYYDERIPYRVWYSFRLPDLTLSGDLELNNQHPAWTILTPDKCIIDSPPSNSLSMYFHKSIPHCFTHQVLYHELFEAEQMYSNKINQPVAHTLAVKATEEFAQQTLSPKEFTFFQNWVSSLSSE